jgi:hypothetical protein
MLNAYGQQFIFIFSLYMSIIICNMHIAIIKYSQIFIYIELKVCIINLTCFRRFLISLCKSIYLERQNFEWQKDKEDEKS